MKPDLIPLMMFFATHLLSNKNQQPLIQNFVNPSPSFPDHRSHSAYSPHSRHSPSRHSYSYEDLSADASSLYPSYEKRKRDDKSDDRVDIEDYDEDNIERSAIAKKNAKKNKIKVKKIILEDIAMHKK